jgi:hypothetical protein
MRELQVSDFNNKNEFKNFKPIEYFLVKKYEPS